jgi:hypothetical protein
LTLEIPHFVVLADGTTAHVKAVAANIVDGQLAQIVYTVEKESGAWAEHAVAKTGYSALTDNRVIDTSG